MGELDEFNKNLAQLRFKYETEQKEEKRFMQAKQKMAKRKVKALRERRLARRLYNKQGRIRLALRRKAPFRIGSFP